MTALPFSTDAPVGIFDSGLGGLSVLRHIQAQLPHEHLLYFADSGFAPYGDKPEAVVVERVLSVAQFLLEQGAKALVVACNTATVAAVRELRERHPGMPIVGVEPGLKPAAALTKSGKVGVLATERTLRSEKFLALRDQIQGDTGVNFLLQPCIGLVDQIESADLASQDTVAMLARYIWPLLDHGADTLVLGCTHYPLVRGAIERVLTAYGAPDVPLVETGDAVARQLSRLLTGDMLARSVDAHADAASLRGYTSARADPGVAEVDIAAPAGWPIARHI
jgi:glutamate racemase